MKKYISVLLIIVTIIFISACDDTNEIQTTMADFESYESSDSAVLYYPECHFNLDTITLGETKSCVFTYTNKGKAPLIISNVFTSCGCVSVEWDKQPLLSEQSDSINLDVTIQGPGYFQKAIVVKNNSINEPVATIRLEGYVIKGDD